MGVLFVLQSKHLKQDLWKQRAVGQQLKKKTFKCKQAEYFLSCEGDEKGD